MVTSGSQINSPLFPFFLHKVRMSIDWDVFCKARERKELTAVSTGKIFVRERRKVGEGEKKPRFSVVGVAGTDLKIFAKHVRKMEVEQIAKEIGAQVVILTAGQDDDDIELDD